MWVLLHPSPCTLADSTTTTTTLVICSHGSFTFLCFFSVLSLFSYTFVDVRNDIQKSLLPSFLCICIHAHPMFNIKPIFSSSSWILIHVDVTFNVNSFIHSFHCPYTLFIHDKYDFDMNSFIPLIVLIHTLYSCSWDVWPNFIPLIVFLHFCSCECDVQFVFISLIVVMHSYSCQGDAWHKFGAWSWFWQPYYFCYLYKVGKYIVYFNFNVNWRKNI